MTGAELQKIIDDYCVMASNTVPGFLFMGGNELFRWFYDFKSEQWYPLCKDY